MKKVLSIIAVAAVATLMFTSCGKKCVCTYYEDGVKQYAVSDADVKSIYEKAYCENQSVAPFQGESSVIDGKEVTIEVKCK
ncbi:MAG: hypothetical protein J6W84_01290 [Bacteroidales bacterium]|nr:hypothetical protein [Bacteroidales bacterium]